jgi:hypothetical protein
MTQTDRIARAPKRRLGQPRSARIALAASLVLNAVLLGKLALVDPIVALRPYCDGGRWTGFVYLSGTTNSEFRNAATGPWLAQWLYFGFRRTEDQIYISGYDYLMKGKRDSQNVFDGIILNTHDSRLEWIKDDPAYIAYVTNYPTIDRGSSYNCDFTRIIAMENND